jgi:hypothetical protein
MEFRPDSEVAGAKALTILAGGGKTEVVPGNKKSPRLDNKQRQENK